VTVGVFGADDDPQVEAVKRAVISLDEEAVTLRLDGAEMRSWEWSVQAIRRADGTRLDDLRSVYVRSVPVAIPQHRSAFVSAHEMADWLAAAERGRAMLGAARAAQRSLADRGVEMVNPVEAFWFHRSKPGADQRLAHHGIPVPRSLVTTEVRSVEAFVAEVGEVVYKPVAGGGACRLLDESALDGAAQALSIAPVLFQERIVGRDLRVYVVGGRVVGTCVIHTEDIDYRGNETGIESIQTWPELESLAVRAAEALGMAFSGIDIKESPEGRLTVLDVNPSPMFVGIGTSTGIDVAGALAAHLVGAST
jgi:RimK family alpha-L-glutamate ligase